MKRTWIYTVCVRASMCLRKNGRQQEREGPNMLFIYQQKGTGRFAFSLTNQGKKLRSRLGIFTLVAEAQANRETHAGYVCRKKLESAQQGVTQGNGDVPGESVIATDLFGQFQVLSMSEFLAFC